ncbi:hypothetical protein GW17_00061216 [Ensete ventricosum]|nr:hypothetical protein GW17_00061216 [Ensete ventricosum]
MDLKAAASVEEEEGNNNAGCGATAWLQEKVVVVCRQLWYRWLQQRCSCDKREEEAKQGTVVAEEGNSVIKVDGCERSLLASFVQQEIAAGCEQGRWHREITTGSIWTARDHYWL